MVDLAPGDCILDSTGCIGIVLDSSDAQAILYKVTCFDGMTFQHTSEQDFLINMTEKFKKAYLREIRRLKRINDERA